MCVCVCVFVKQVFWVQILVRSIFDPSVFFFFRSGVQFYQKMLFANLYSWFYYYFVYLLACKAVNSTAAVTHLLQKARNDYLYSCYALFLV